jgi:hypothetical protein
MLSRSDVKTLGCVNSYEMLFSSRNVVNPASAWKLGDSAVENCFSFPLESVKVPEMSEAPIESVPVMSPALTCSTNCEYSIGTVSVLPSQLVKIRNASRSSGRTSQGLNRGRGTPEPPDPPSGVQRLRFGPFSSSGTRPSSHPPRRYDSKGVRELWGRPLSHRGYWPPWP